MTEEQHNPSEPLLMTPAEFQQVLADLGVSISNKALWAWRQTGEGPRFVRMGSAKSSRIYYPTPEVKDWVFRTFTDLEGASHG